MMMQDHQGTSGKILVLRDQLSTLFGMGSHDIHFLWQQCAGLRQDLIGDADLSNIME